MAKSKKNKTYVDQILSVLLAIMILVSIGVYAYGTFVEKSAPSEDETTPIVPQTTILMVTLGSQSYNFTLDQLIAYPNVTGQGAFITNTGRITGPDHYTGVSMTILLDSLPSPPENYTLHAIAYDGYSLDYTRDEVQGHIMMYDNAGEEKGIGNLTMMIAYKENGIVMNESMGGPLRITFIDDAGSITHASEWLRSLQRIDIQ